MSLLATAGFVIFILILFLGIFLNFFELPGTVIIFFDILLYSVFTGFEKVGWEIILFLLVSAMIAETIDFFWTISETPQQAVSPRRSINAASWGAFIGVSILTPFFGGPGIWIGFLLGGLSGILIAEIIRQYQLKIYDRTLNRVILNIVGKNVVKGFISLCMIAFSLSNIYA